MMKQPQQKTEVPYKHIVIDLTNLFFRAFYRGTKYNKNTDDAYIKYCTSPLEYALNSLEKLKADFGGPDTIYYLLLDNPDSAYKMRAIISFGDYKSSRKKNGASIYLYTMLNIFIDILKSYSNQFRIVSSLNLEADDLTLPVKLFINPSYHERCLFVSVDMDWARNIDETNCSHWYNWSELYDYNSFKEKFEFAPTGNSVKMYKAIHGDPADSIQNAVPNLPKELLLWIIENFATPDALFDQLQSTELPKQWKSKLKDAERQIRINWQLVDFFPITDPLENMIVECKENKAALRLWAKSLKMKNLTAKYDVEDHFFEMKA